MIRRIGQLNRVLQAAITTAEPGNSAMIFEMEVPSNNVLEISGINWGAAMLVPADKTNFQFQHVTGYWNFNYDVTTNPFSRSNPSTETDVLFFIGQHNAGLGYEDFADPWVSPSGGKITVVCVQPLFSAAQTGSIILSLAVHGKVVYHDSNYVDVGGKRRRLK